MKLTGNKNVDTIFAVAIVGGAAWIGYNIFKTLKDKVTPPTGRAAPLPEGCEISQWRQLTVKQHMDGIYNAHSGVNFFNYPEKVNVILSYNKCELEYANGYFIQTYGQSLYNNIYNEWDVDGDYDAAENYLKQNGLGN